MFLPWHFHIDLHRTDRFVSLLHQFPESVHYGPIQLSGMDIYSCFRSCMNIRVGIIIIIIIIIINKNVGFTIRINIRIITNSNNYF